MPTITINNIPADATPELAAQAWAEWSPVTITCTPSAALSATLTIGGEQLGAPTTTPFDPLWRWTWQPRGSAGTIHGCVTIIDAAGLQHEHTFRFNLVPRLLDQHTWAQLLADLAHHARSVAMALGGSAFAQAVLVPLWECERTPLEEALLLLEHHQHELEVCIKRIREHPATRLKPTAQRDDLTTLRYPPSPHAQPPQQLEQLPEDQVPQALRALHQRLGGLPRSISTQHASASFDLPEHRWLVGIIAELQRRGRALRNLAEHEQQRGTSARLQTTLAELAARLERMLAQLRRWRSEPPLINLPPRSAPPSNSQLLARDQRYRPLRRLWSTLRTGPLLTLEVGALGLPLNDLPTLYEQWCCLMIADVLCRQGGQIVQQQLLVEDTARERWTLSLTPHAPLLEIAISGVHYRLRYQARYTSQPDALGIVALDGYVRIPDVVLEIIHPQRAPLLIVFDAKYRRAPDGRAPQDALDDAYAYRGSLGSNGQSRVHHAVICYPAERAAEDYGTVGVIPLLPKHVSALEDYIQHVLKFSLED